MQQHSFPDDTCDRLIVHPDRQADKIKHQMLAERDDVSQAVGHLERIAFILCERVRDYVAETYPARAVVPVFVMRGGLIMRTAATRVFSGCLTGLVVPFRRTSMERPTIVYGDVPVPACGALYLALDLLVATGSTMVSALESIYLNLGSNAAGDVQVQVVSPFAATIGIQAIIGRFPGVIVHAIWHQEKVDANNRMVGPGFDIGDYALGGPGTRRVRWADKGP